MQIFYRMIFCFVSVLIFLLLNQCQSKLYILSGLFFTIYTGIILQNGILEKIHYIFSFFSSKKIKVLKRYFSILNLPSKMISDPMITSFYFVYYFLFIGNVYNCLHFISNRLYEIFLQITVNLFECRRKLRPDLHSLSIFLTSLSLLFFLIKLYKVT